MKTKPDQFASIVYRFRTSIPAFAPKSLRDDWETARARHLAAQYSGSLMAAAEARAEAAKRFKSPAAQPALVVSEAPKRRAPYRRYICAALLVALVHAIATAQLRSPGDMTSLYAVLYVFFQLVLNAVAASAYAFLAIRAFKAITANPFPRSD